VAAQMAVAVVMAVMVLVAIADSRYHPVVPTVDLAVVAVTEIAT